MAAHSNTIADGKPSGGKFDKVSAQSPAEVQIADPFNLLYEAEVRGDMVREMLFVIEDKVDELLIEPDDLLLQQMRKHLGSIATLLRATELIHSGSMRRVISADDALTARMAA